MTNSQVIEFIYDDIWLHIFKFLQEKDLRSLSQTCKKFSKLASSDILWKPLYAIDFYAQHMSSRFKKKAFIPRQAINSIRKLIQLNYEIKNFPNYLILYDLNQVYSRSWKELYKEGFFFFFFKIQFFFLD